MRELTADEIRSLVIAGGTQTLSTVHVTAQPISSGGGGGGGAGGGGGGGTGGKSTTARAPTHLGGAPGPKPPLPPESQWKSFRNNPGDLKWAPWEGNFGGSQTPGSSFATFATEQDGINAMQQLLSSTYGSDTINAMISAYAPPQSNPTASYQDDVAAWSGLSGATVISTLDSAQMESLLYAMARFEGNTTF